MRARLIMLLLLLGVATSAPAQVNIDVNFSVFPQLVRVPDYPVYYAPRQNANYFFYDGMYWVYQNDGWYSSDWYNGPWYSVAPEYVPLYVLRVPVRYYRRPPAYFRGWSRDAPPRWGDHWGRAWEQQHNGWDRWNRRAAPAPAPLPTYQRQYSGNRYPRPEEQRVIHDQKYHYQPRDESVREHVQPQMRAAAPAQERQPDRRNENAKDARDQHQAPGKGEQRPAAVNPPPARPEPQKQGETQHAPAPAGERQPDARKDHRPEAREREQKSAPARPPQSTEPAARSQAAPAPRERAPEAPRNARPPEAARSERPPEAARRPPETRREERPAVREQPHPAAQPPRPQPQAAPRPAAPPPRPAAPPPAPKPAAAPPQPHPAPGGRGPEHEKGKGD